MKYKFFWNGTPFSNWWIVDFVGDCNIKFNCVEQYMMFEKAMYFHDTDTAILILSAETPREQKKLGRLVKNYTNEWDEVRYDIVKKGVREKFLQNPDLKRKLLKYKGYTFVEASPYDKIWGIGFDEEHALENIENWGQNLLGKMLTELSLEFDEE